MHKGKVNGFSPMIGQTLKQPATKRVRPAQGANKSAFSALLVFDLPLLERLANMPIQWRDCGIIDAGLLPK
jgi:hypothetical protein